MRRDRTCARAGWRGVAGGLERPARGTSVSASSNVMRRWQARSGEGSGTLRKRRVLELAIAWARIAVSEADPHRSSAVGRPPPPRRQLADRKGAQVRLGAVGVEELGKWPRTDIVDGDEEEQVRLAGGCTPRALPAQAPGRGAM